MGEAEFGLLNGVFETRSGFLGGGEVVEVRFDPNVISFDKLLRHATDNECASKVFTRTNQQQALARQRIGQRAERSDEPIRTDKDPKYYLGKTALGALPMTELQANRVNASLKTGTWKQWLSPRQLELLKRIKARQAQPKLRQPPVAIGVPLMAATQALTGVL